LCWSSAHGRSFGSRLDAARVGEVALAADSSQRGADSSLDPPDSSLPASDSSLRPGTLLSDGL